MEAGAAAGGSCVQGLFERRQKILDVLELAQPVRQGHAPAPEREEEALAGRGGLVVLQRGLVSDIEEPIEGLGRRVDLARGANVESVQPPRGVVEIAEDDAEFVASGVAAIGVIGPG